jgi:predicted AAA+ superfamily ATPase
MTAEEIEPIFRTSNRLIRETDCGFHRYLSKEIDWNEPFVCIMGARGAGKTTLMLQHIKETFGEGSDKAIYMSLDSLWFSKNSVLESVEYLYSHGFTHVFLDEVHHVGKDWSLLLKNLSDQFPSMSFAYSGSSLLKLDKGRGDLSRRQSIYRLRGLSFREYLEFEGVGRYEPLELGQIVKDHISLASRICSDIKILPYFDKYRRCGFYPFYKRSPTHYLDQLLETVHKVLDVDYPGIEEVSQDTIRKAKKMLMILSSSCPQTPNMSALYRELGTERAQGLKMLSALERAGLLALLPPKGETLKNMSKPEKIYCDNTNLMYALVQNANIGTLRETFFCNQVRKDHAVVFTERGDFLVDGKWTFEVGGKGKGFDQIKNLPDSYVVNDDVEVGFGNKIPLWLFGFLY